MLKIVPFQADHAEEAAALHAISFDRPWPVKDFQTYANCKTIFGASAFKNNQFIGFALARKTVDEAEIFTIAITALHRNQGAGQELLKYIFNLLLHNKTKNVYLEVIEDNQCAKALYKRAGFLKIGERPNYYLTADRTRKAAHLYEKRLSF